MSYEATPSGEPRPTWLGGVASTGISGTPLAPLVAAAYAQRTDVENIYGPTNVAKWADVENNENTAFITNRIYWALSLATAKLNGRLLGGPYRLPFSSPYPTELIDATARLAGMLLYESRGISDQEGGEGKDGVVHHLGPQRKDVVQFVNNLLSGRLRFPGLSTATSYPRSVDITPASATNENAVDQTGWELDFFAWTG